MAKLRRDPNHVGTLGDGVVAEFGAKEVEWDDVMTEGAAVEVRDRFVLEGGDEDAHDGSVYGL